MNGPEGKLQRLRLWLAAYGGNQSDERRRRMGEAMARYLKAVGFRRSPGGDVPVEPIEPIRGIDRRE
jgi:hypothetical protein